MARRSTSGGFSLIEMLVVVVVVGILASIAMQSLTVSVQEARRMQTERKLEVIAKAIVGNSQITEGGVRSSFGYVGDVGAFPTSLAALYTNPGGLPTWAGPYILPDFTQDTVSYRLDGWGAAFTYTGGMTITSSGGGTPVVKKLGNASSDYLLNQFLGVVKDKNDSLPGAIWKDSINVKVDFPAGGSGMITKTYHPDAFGNFKLDSVPAGQRSLSVIFTPLHDTLHRMITVLPRENNACKPVYKFSQAYFVPANSGPLAYWRFDEGSGAVAHDSTSHAYTGTLTNMNTATAWVAGKTNGALTFDGVNDYVNVGSSFPSLTTLTVTAWVKPSSNAQDRQIVSKGFNGTRTEWELKTTTNAGNVSIRHWAPTAVGVESVHTLTVGVWTHLAGTYDGVTWKIYWNGVLDNQAVNSAPVATNNNLCIGAVDINGSPGQFWAGAIDEVRIYNRALSAAEIAALAH